MTRSIKLSIIMVAVAFFCSCATSMSPSEVNDRLPTLTSSTYYSLSEADEALAEGRCTYIDRGKSFTAPNGISYKRELRNAANGIDEWVDVDGGNAYILRNYKWETVGNGSTQLKVEFDTMLCQD